MAQVLFFDFFPEKDPHLNTVENKKIIYYASATDAFLGNSWTFWKQPQEVFYEESCF